MRTLVRLLLIISASALVVGCAAATASGGTPAGSARSSGATGTPATQTIERAGVTVVATWNGPSGGAVFELKLDNHMIDLASVDLAKATLVNDRGERATGPAWAGGSSGHHREGTLTFTVPGSFFEGASTIQLGLPAIADATPRDFSWQISK